MSVLWRRGRALLFQLRRRRRLRPVLLAGIVLLVVAEIVVLSPSSLEDTEPRTAAVDPDSLVEGRKNLAVGVPTGRIPDYRVEGFNYVSTQGREKQWMIDANEALMYNAEKLVHARTTKAYLYDADGKITIVTGLEAKYSMGGDKTQRDLEVYGDVKTTFPDGFVLTSDYLRYRPLDRTVIIPPEYVAHGNGKEKDGQRLDFTSHGLQFAMAKSTILLERDVRFKMIAPPKAPAKGEPRVVVPDVTEIISDTCVIDRKKQVAHFDMRKDPETGTYHRFVEIEQNTMYARSRNADLDYGDYAKLLNYMTAYQDVFIREKGEGPDLRYATSGRADFDTHRDVIVLTKFPQVYQGEDTVTGEVIIMHRDSDVVEVEHSNSFSAPKPESDQP